MRPDLKERLSSCKTLPSPPGVASKIIKLANEPEIDIDEIVRVLVLDPAITTKILRVVNSPMYSLVRKTENLRDAVVVLGLNATISLALSFSLLKSLPHDGANAGIDYALYWRRALLAATASRVVAETVGLRAAEELFLASVIQDVGMLALEQSIPDIYKDLPKQSQQAAVIQRECDKVGIDHACVGGWLLERWCFPDRIRLAVSASHDLDTLSTDHEHGLFARCVAVTSLIAEVFLDDTADHPDFAPLLDAVQKHLRLNKQELGEMIEKVGILIPEAEEVFETRIKAESNTERLMEDAREILMIRNLSALQTVDSLQVQADSLQDRTKKLEESNRRDALTGLYNRGFLDHFLETAFAESVERHEPLSIAFTDLDKFKDVNDTYGHQVGDQILATTANILNANVRSSDIVARYGGEEFIIVFPNSNGDLVNVICQRIVQAFQDARHDVGTPEEITVTISVGMATQNENRSFKSIAAFIEAADQALYTAKLQGRNRSIPFDLVEKMRVGQK